MKSLCHKPSLQPLVQDSAQDFGLIVRGAQAIARAVGIRKADVPRFVATEALPAWRYNQFGTWIARPEALRKWVEEQEKKRLRMDGNTA